MLRVLLFATRGKTVERLRGSSRIEDPSFADRAPVVSVAPGGTGLGSLGPVGTADWTNSRATSTSSRGPVEHGTAWYRNISNVQLLTVMYSTEKHETW